MDRKGKCIVPGPFFFLLIAGCVWISGVSPVRAQLADGTWTVQGEGSSGSRRCGAWLVRLTNLRGQLSGTVSHARTTVPIQNLVLVPDRRALASRAGLDFQSKVDSIPRKPPSDLGSARMS